MQAILTQWFAIYSFIQECHYELARQNTLYRVVIMTFFVLSAPLLQILIWLPYLTLCYIDQLIDFYKWVPDGYRGERRNY